MSMSGNAEDQGADIVRAGDRDRFLAILFAPADRRPHLFALHAFALEIAGVRARVSEPLPGEIRLQWWREVLEGERAGEAAAHPLAAALLDAVERFRLPRAALVAMTEARIFDLYDDPMLTVSDLEGYCGETESALIRLSSIILADGADPQDADAAGHGGVALGVTRILRALPEQSRRGQCFVPVEMLARHGASRESFMSGQVTPENDAVLAEMRELALAHLARARTAARPAGVLPGYLPLALIEPDLKRMAGASGSPLPPWRRQWRLWRAARAGRF